MPLAVDRFSEIFPLLEKYTTTDFWNLSEHEIRPDTIYLVGRTQFYDHRQLIKDLTEKSTAKFILANPHEGSDTMRQQLSIYGMTELVQSGRILLIGGGDMDGSWPCLQFDHFLPKVFDYEENRLAANRIDEIYDRHQKPYKFLFLNGRYRPHRAWLVQHWHQVNFLEHALWSNLDIGNGPVQLLPKQYEVERYQKFIDASRRYGYVKFDLFDNEWGEIYLNADAYIDTYFSVVSETVHEYPYSFRTEKIWKPIAMGHPFVVVANRGYLKDLRNLGFRTFGNILDESYDDVDDTTERLQRVADLVENLVRENLDDFLLEAQDICKYNQQHLVSMSSKVRQEFPDRFLQFLQRYQWMI